MKYGPFLPILLLLFFLSTGCKQPDASENNIRTETELTALFPFDLPEGVPLGEFTRPLADTVHVHDFFCFVDSLVYKYDSLTDYTLTEHLLVNANPQIIDSLEAFDYYRMMAERDSFVYEQRSLAVLLPGDSLLIPSATLANHLKAHLDSNIIDLNIPEFKLRILNSGDTLYTFHVRVGRYERKYLELAGNTVDLRTERGKGKMVRHARDPIFINPCDGKRFYLTRRDDGRTTTMPLIPWMEPELNGIRYGQLIHPTTNPKTLGKPYSNGCVGTTEADAWRIYYNAPIGTRVDFHYNLEIVNAKGDTVRLKDIYGWGKK